MKDYKNIKLLILDVDGTLTDGGIYIMEDGSQFKKFNSRDGMGIRLLQKAGIEVGIISNGKTTSMVQARADMLGMTRVYVGEAKKMDVLEAWMTEMGIGLDQVGMVGDDINDLPVMEKAGLSACPADAVRAVKEKADIVLQLKGGEGCVRELIDNYLLAD
ncbi:HAD-IIIA family hydrolase [Imperialibacter roseus]|uniref:HAD-IIIA family hydrolase n=1 Tax=Imperialibacter roseus TaxID=1324217 RepID=A0ABZ0IQ36_9BACT|nr:HAD-IIIA family hydrolase [Imperialibacter roseus]WOK06811.1 HAD-IIIA family hydrolase [Imperialibacter roseus]